jgi:kumamolisin
MSQELKRIPIPGSRKQKILNAEVRDEAPTGEFTVTVTVRRRQKLPSLEAQGRLKTRERTYLSREEHARLYGADPADIRKVENYAREHGLSVVRSDPAQRIVVLGGTAAAYSQAFGVELKTYILKGKEYRGRVGEIFVPAELDGIVTSVTGLDNRPFAKPHYRIHRDVARPANASLGTGASTQARAIGAGFTPLEIASLYDFPPNLDGSGETIAILQLGGGFRADELNRYFENLGLKPPKVTVASYPNGGTNDPGTDPLDPANFDVEVMLDIEVAGAVAPGANIVVCFAPDASDQGFLSAMTAIVHDTLNKPSIVSISWGGPEDSASDQFRNEFDQLLQSAAHLGITVCVSAGDNGSADFACDDPNWDHQPHVDFPASSAYSLSCGGTRLSVSNGGISTEVVWHDGGNAGTGGGISRFFAMPSYQRAVRNSAEPAGSTMRGVPDVSGHASPDSGYCVLCDGQTFPDLGKHIPPVGGTSAVAPLWAGLIARWNQSLGKPVGFVNALLYELARTDGFRDITQGDNGDYRAGPGWDPCTGLGSPNGSKILAALSSSLV